MMIEFLRYADLQLERAISTAVQARKQLAEIIRAIEKEQWGIHSGHAARDMANLQTVHAASLLKSASQALETSTLHIVYPLKEPPKKET